jgi:hypothetical protein
MRRFDRSIDPKGRRLIGQLRAFKWSIPSTSTLAALTP